MTFDTNDSLDVENGIMKAKATETITDPTSGGKQTASFASKRRYVKHTIYIENGSDGQVDVQLQSSPDGGTTWVDHGPSPSKQVSSGADDLVTLNDAVDDLRVDVSGTSGNVTGDVDLTIITRSDSQ